MLAMQEIEKRFVALSQALPIGLVRSEQHHDQLVTAMNLLMDHGAANENHPLADLLDVLGNLVADYEATHLPRPTVTGLELLKFLMRQHGLRQADLPEIGSQGVVSEVLNGKRALNTRQVRALASRFGLEPGAFL